MANVVVKLKTKSKQGKKRKFQIKSQIDKMYSGKESYNEYLDLLNDRVLAEREIDDIRNKFKALVLLRTSSRIYKSEILNIIRPHKISYKHPIVKQELKKHNLLFHKIEHHEFYIDRSVLLRLRAGDIDTCTMDILDSGRTVKRITEFMNILSDTYGVNMDGITCDMMRDILKRNKIERDITGWRTKTHSLNHVKSHFKITLDKLGLDRGREFNNTFFDLTGSRP